MKLNFILVFSLFITVNLLAQAPRKSLVQEWTNASCGPCAALNPAFDSRLNTYSNKVVVSKIQVSYPGYDPMHNDYKAVLDYYADSVYVDGDGNSLIDRVPRVILDGLSVYSPEEVTEAVLGTLPATSPIAITMDHQVDTNGDSITINVKYKNVSANTITGDLRTFVALNEKVITYAVAPGSNGERIFNHVLRKFLTNKTGTPYTSIAAGDSIVMAFRSYVPSYIADPRQLEVIAYLQNWDTKFVYNAEVSAPRPTDISLPDLGITTKSFVANTGLCDYDVSFKLFVKNLGTLPINNFKVEYFVNGTLGGSIPYNRTLNTNDTIIAEFNNVQLADGKSVISYKLSDINGAPRDLYSLNNFITSNSVITAPRAVVSVAGLEQNFENFSTPGLPANYVNSSTYNSAFRVFSSADVGFGPNELGAYGTSDQALGINYYGWSTNTYGQIGRLFLPKLKINATNLKLVYDRAHAKYTDASTPTPPDDRLRFEYSTNCGSTWTTIVEKTGAELETAAPQEPAFIPTSNQWATDTINLPTFAADSEILFSITGVSDYGNYLWLDNLRFLGITSTGDPVAFDGKINLYPNPISTELNIEISPNKQENISVDIIDLTGKVVENIANNTPFAAGKHTLVWKPTVAAGFYFLRTKSESGETTKKISIIK